jgi:hypothetical protein
LTATNQPSRLTLYGLQEPPAFGDLRFHRLADVALTDPPEEGKGIDSRIMPVAPGEPKCIPTHRLHILKPDQQWDVIRFDSELAGHLIGALGTGAMLSEIADRINAFVPVIPVDAEHSLI